MGNVSGATKIRQALDVNSATVKIALLFTVMWAGLYLWKRTLLDLGMVCVWAGVSVLGILVYRVRKRKLKVLDPD